MTSEYSRSVACICSIFVDEMSSVFVAAPVMVGTCWCCSSSSAPVLPLLTGTAPMLVDSYSCSMLMVDSAAAVM